MGRPIVFSTLAVFAAIATGFDGGASSGEPDESRRHSEPSGGFSFIPPDGWDILPFPGMKFKLAVGPQDEGFSPNLNVVDETFDGPMDEYVKQGLARMGKVFEDFRILRQEGFETEAGVRGVRAIVEDEQQDRPLRQTFYFFSRGKAKLVVACTAAADGGEVLDPVFEACLKTFRFFDVPPPSDEPDDSPRHSEPAGGFSFIPPEGWVLRPYPGMKFKMAVGPQAEGFSPNINVVDGPFDGTLDAFVEQNIASLAEILEGFRLIRREEFQTEAGLRGVRVIVEDEQNGTRLRQTLYAFEAGPTKFMVTCTTGAEGGDALDPTFEACMKTFRFDRR